jgi:hypothetical protein
MARFAAGISILFVLTQKEPKKSRSFPEICGQKIRPCFAGNVVFAAANCFAPLYFERTSPLAPDAKVGTGAKLLPDLSAIRRISGKNRSPLPKVRD